MFGAQTAKQFQDNCQKHKDSMKDNSYSGDKHKNSKSVRFQIEEDKVREAVGRSIQRKRVFSKGRGKMVAKYRDKRSHLKQGIIIIAIEGTSSTSQQSSSVSRLAGVRWRPLEVRAGDTGFRVNSTSFTIRTSLEPSTHIINALFWRE